MSRKPWMAYASAATAALAAPVAGQAAVQVIAPVGLTLANPSSGNNLSTDLNGDAVDDVNFVLGNASTAQTAVFQAFSGAKAQTVSNMFTAPGGMGASFSNFGTKTFGATSFNETASNGLPRNATVTLGVALSGGQSGWIRVRLDTGNLGGINNSFTSLSVLGGAYEDSGAGIHVGTVPEPTSLAFLATGALGVAALRRRPRKPREAAKD